MLGAVIGDISGSQYEFDNKRSKDIEILDGFYTDDTILTFAVAKSLLESKDKKDLKKHLIRNFKRFVRDYPSSYGVNFFKWAMSTQTKPYGSKGNGSAMRVSPVAYFATTLEEAEELAKITAEVTHNHPEGIRGAKAVAGAIFLARTGADKEEILDYVRKFYPHDFLKKFNIDAQRDYYEFDGTCQGSVPYAIEAFLEGDSFEDVIKTAVSVGGDSDTIAAIAGSIAEAYYGIEPELKEQTLEMLNDEMRDIYKQFEDRENEGNFAVRSEN